MIHGNDIPVLVIFGVTASGKTALSEALFLSDPPEINLNPSNCSLRGKAEIISADSMQVYRGMDIGTAKPHPDVLRDLPHHLIDICNPNEQFCAGDFVRLADKACADIHARGKLPVILGGTAFYIRNFLYGLPVTPESDCLVRQTLRKRMDTEGASVLHCELELVDSVSAARIHINDEYRILRALEVYEASSKPLSSFKVSHTYRPGYRILFISLDRPRAELYQRIDARVLNMFDAGLEDEVRSLREAGWVKDDPGMQAIGYREFFSTSDGNMKTEAICAQIQHNSRHYAKRQETFIRSFPGVMHFPADDFVSIYHAVSAFYSSICKGTLDGD